MNQSIPLGEELTNFKSFTVGMDSHTKGLVIGNSEKIRTVHNSFRKQEPFVFENKDQEGPKEDAFHFVAYIKHKSDVYELDGLQPGPIYIGPCTENWVDVAKKQIELRI
jgi:ubiquitin carboxyl-terminal hydrolase L5